MKHAYKNTLKKFDKEKESGKFFLCDVIYELTFTLCNELEALLLNNFF
jgi:hypothetical protein